MAYFFEKKQNKLKARRYCYAVTGATSHIQYPESGGGVLADDMGMGKSLSILSLVAKTSDQADEWLHASDAESSKTRSKATLIIVSSAREFGPVIEAIEWYWDANVTSVDQRMDTWNEQVGFQR